MIDEQTHKDVVELIRIEMSAIGEGQGCSNWNPSAERLACLIEGRLGHESPSKSVIPNLPPQPWKQGRNPDDPGEVELLDANGTGFLIWVGMDEHTKPFMDLVIAAPDVVEAGAVVVKQYLEAIDAVEREFPGAGLSSNLWGKEEEYLALLKAVKKAGVDLGS